MNSLPYIIGVSFCSGFILGTIMCIFIVNYIVKYIFKKENKVK